MSFIRLYHINCKYQYNTNGFEINAIVNAGNSKVAIQKFMMRMGLDDNNYILTDQILSILRADHRFTKHKDLAYGVKEYTNSDNTIRIVTRRLNRNSDLTFIESHRITERSS